MRGKGMLNIETFCIIMRKYVQAQKVDEAVYTFNITKKYYLPPNLAAFNGLLSTLYKSKNVRKAPEIFDTMKNDQFCPDSKSYSILVEGWGRAPNLPKAREIFNEIFDSGGKPDIVTYGIMVDILCKARHTDEAVGNRIEDGNDTFLQMEKNGMKVDVAVYNSLINAFCKVSKFENAYKVVDEMDKKGGADEAFKVFWKLSRVCEPDADTYSMMIKMFYEKDELDVAHKGEASGACVLMKEMMERGIRPGRHTFEKLRKLLVKEEMEDIAEFLPAKMYLLVKEPLCDWMYDCLLNVVLKEITLLFLLEVAHI
ncbi:hypothetical protein SASPL_108153 [Salvia splendens]|uniref:Pentatricopeptide repeat domain-containing protein 1 n=1 Tax=Salvia splendens TaxID=180675 RepID=A0A8X9A5Y7_SALSN|nr:hypothetical protein SASPL_108153 [Salvia splendens]